MDFIKESLETPIRDTYDVIVVGAGPAGCGAALAAARGGARTLILDKFNCLGGLWTTGFMNPVFDIRNKGGIMRELLDELARHDAWGGFRDISFHYETMKKLLEDKLTEAGAHILFNTVYTRTLVENNRVIGVVVENIDGRGAYLANTVIDCTGDGNVAAGAGCAFDIGEDGDYRTCQGMTLMFLVGNIPQKYEKGLMIGDLLIAAYEKEGLEIPFRRPFLIPVPGTRYGVVQFTHMYEYDPLSAKDITAATIEGRRQMNEAFGLLKKHDPDFRELELISSANVLGIRESRRIIGEYYLTDEDVLNGRHFDDDISEARFGIDIHPKNGRAQDCRKSKPYGIPFRCLIPRGIDGLLVAGRCISGSHIAMASYRVTGDCCSMGEAAGNAAAYVTKNGGSFHEMDAATVRAHISAPIHPVPEKL